MKNIYFFGVFTFLLLISCPEPNNINDGEGTINPHPTSIIFDNRNNPFPVNLYSSPDRVPENLIATIEERKQSGAIPSSCGIHGIYPEYILNLNEENIVIRHNPLPPNHYFEQEIFYGQINNVRIPELAPLVSVNTPLVNDVYLYIKNSSGTSLLRLQRSNVIISTQDGRQGINPRETALYNDIHPGNAFEYLITVVGVTYPFPADLIFERGHVYIFDFNGSIVSLERNIPISLENVIKEKTVRFVPNGGTPAPSNQTIIYGRKINEPRLMTKSGNTFAGWYREPNHITKWDFDNDTVTDNMTLYAKWSNNQHTIRFDINGGSGLTPLTQTANALSSITLPDVGNLTKHGRAFGGWNTKSDGTGNNFNASSSYTVNGDIIFYANWVPITVPGATLANKFSWLQTNAVTGGIYTIEVNANESISPTTLSYSNRNNIAITLIGIGSRRTISLSSNGSMFTVNSGVTMTLDNNITLQGRTANTNPLLTINNGGHLIMNNGARITGNTINTHNNGAGATGGTPGGSGGSGATRDGPFNNGTSNGSAGGNGRAGNGNTAIVGGIIVSGTFVMNGGEIDNNRGGQGAGGAAGTGGAGGVIGSTGNTGGTGNRGGTGGVEVSSTGRFTMLGGVIQNNHGGGGGGAGSGGGGGGGGASISSSFLGSYGDGGNGGRGGTGGVGGTGGLHALGTFTRSGGTIHNNYAGLGGGAGAGGSGGGGGKLRDRGLFGIPITLGTGSTGSAGSTGTAGSIGVHNF
jgi:uncharacterized repeat protein (TIGR02543 family)